MTDVLGQLSTERLSGFRAQRRRCQPVRYPEVLGAMGCPHCQSLQTRNLNRRTDLGYAVFRCGACRAKFNDRTVTQFNFLDLPTVIVFENVLCRLFPHLSLRDVPEMYLL